MNGPPAMQPGQRLSLALKAARPYRVFKSLSSEDLFLMMLDADPEEIELAIKYAHEDQHRDIIDLCAWERDNIHPEMVLDWLSRLLKCGHGKLIKVIKKLDPELLIYTFKQYIDVVLKEDPDDPAPEREHTLSGPRTLDNVYYYFHLKDDFTETIDAIIAHIFSYNPKAYMNLARGCMNELNMELMENAFRWRTNRMEEKGFLNYLDSRTILEEIDAEDIERLKKFPHEEIKPEGGAKEESLAAHSYFCAIPSTSYLIKTMERVEERINARELKWETVLAMNKLISASLPALTDIKQIKSCLEYGADAISLALDYLSDGDMGAAARLILTLRIETLLRVGRSLTMNKAGRLKRFFRSSNILQPETLFLLDSPQMEILDALLKTPPLCYDPEKVSCANFVNREEIDRVNEVIDDALCLDRLFFNGFRLQLEGIREFRKYKLLQNELTFANLFISGLCNIILNRHFEFQPVPESRFSELLSRAFTRESGAAKLREEYAFEFFKWFDEMEMDGDEIDRGLSRRILSKWINAFAEEVGALDPSSVVDPKFVKTVLVRAD